MELLPGILRFDARVGALDLPDDARRRVQTAYDEFVNSPRTRVDAIRGKRDLMIECPDMQGRFVELADDLTDELVAAFKGFHRHLLCCHNHTKYARTKKYEMH